MACLELEYLLSLAGKSVVITGGATGIGRYIALGAAQRGARVAVGDIDAEAVRSVHRELRSHSTHCITAVVDIRDPHDAERLMNATAQAFGGLDYLVNNAALVPHFRWGGTRWPTVQDMPFEFWSNVVATNLHGTFLSTKYAISHLRRRGGGHIVNVYGGGKASPPGALTYVVTKEAGVVFSRYLAEEVRAHNICVMSMSPGGAIATERAPDQVRDVMPGPELAGDRFFLAADAGMELSGHVVDVVDGALVIAD